MQVKIYQDLEARVTEAYTAYGEPSRRSLPEFLNYMIDKGLDLCDIKRGISFPDFIEFDNMRIHTEAGSRKYFHNEPEAVQRKGTKIIPFPQRGAV